MEKLQNNCNCGCNDSNENSTTSISTFDTILPSVQDQVQPDVDDGIPCCGPPPGPAADPFEKPGYVIEPFVTDFISTNAGNVPIIDTKKTVLDSWQTFLVRLNVGRNNYRISPGLYAAGSPNENAPILVTANYKLSFDYLRKELSDIDAWIIILDTRGINVWCAAGKGTFGTEELINRINATGIEKIVSHRKLIVPQLGAVGIAGREIKKKTGFSVIWGPVHTKDIKAFLSKNMKAEPEMREVSFSLSERIALIPVEVSLAMKPALIAIGVILLLSMLSSEGTFFISLNEALSQGGPAIITFISGIIAGAVVTPIFLRQLPATEFSVKGAISGVAIALPISIITAHSTGLPGVIALTLAAVAFSSFLAMNFTGTTPFTSPSGVEKEMRRAIPIQAGTLFLAAILWVYATF